MLHGLETALNLIYPPTCLTCRQVVEGNAGLCGPCWRETAFIGGTVCDSCGVPLPGGRHGEVAHCDACLRDPPPWVQGRSALLYRDMGRKIVLAFKHGDRQEIAAPAALWMAQAIGRYLQGNTLIAPVPLHWSRMIKRKFNQSALLGKALAGELGCAWCPDLLQRTRRTQVLDGKTRTERYTAVQGAMAVHPRRTELLRGRPILLVDDVMTSGATLSCATQACLDAGAGEIRVVTLARVAKDT